MPEIGYKLLIGPLFKPSVIGSYLQNPEIKVFGQVIFSETYPYDILYPPTIKHFNEILEQLPNNWQPDLVIWWDLVFQALPPGIAECPYPTAVVVGDWNLNFLSVTQTVTAFDYIFADQLLIELLQKRGFKNCSYWPQFSFEPEKYYTIPNTEKIYDISFVGNFHPLIHQKRSNYLERLAKFSQKYRVYINGEVYGQEYLEVLNQSKIVFNHSVRREMNMRAYEAAACSALVFMEDSNLEVERFLTNGQSCILYNTDNFEDLLEYYLTHEDKRLAITQEGHRVIQNYSYEKQFAQLLQQLPQMIQQFQSSALRAFLAYPQEQQELIQLQQLLNASSLDAPQILNHYLEASQIYHQSTPDPHIGNALAVILLKTYLQTQNKEGVTFALDKAQQFLEQALEQLPNHSLLLYHLGWCHQLRYQDEKALQCYQLSLDHLHWPIPLFEQFKHFVMPNYYCRFNVEWQLISASTEEAQEIAYLNLLRWQLGRKIGEIYEQQRDWSKALQSYQDSAQSGGGFYESWLSLAKVSHYLGQLEQALDYYLKATDTQALLISVWPKIAGLLVYFKRYQEVVSQTEQWFIILQSNPQSQTVIKQLKNCQVIAQIAQELEKEQPNKHQIKNLLSREYDLQFHRLLNNSFPNIPWITMPLKITWNPPLFEPIPLLHPGTHITFSDQEADFLIHNSVHQENKSFKRSYHQPSQLEQWIIGPDLMPYSFPPLPLQPSESELINTERFNFLLILEEHSFNKLEALLSDILELLRQIEEVNIVLWKPLTELHEQEIQVLEELLPLDYQERFIILDADLSLVEQISLLQGVKLVLGWGESDSLYYLYWSLFLQTPTLFLTNPSYIYPDLEESQADLVKTPKLLDLYRDFSKLIITQNKITAWLHDFYKNKAQLIYQQAFWQIRLKIFGDQT